MSTARGGNLQKWEGTLCQRGHVHSHSIHCSDLPPFPLIDQIPTQQPNFIEFPHLAVQVPVGTKEAACGYGAVASTSGFAKGTGLYPFIIGSYLADSHFFIPIFYSALFGALSVEGWLEYFQPLGHGRFMLRGVGREDALQPVHEGWTEAAWMHPSG